ncbi:MerR family transcriptional regulator [Clostridium saccharobutylicum]|uniref:HTH-type transcriptional regulator AdhR n=1 Tax=Clostridium saccharobutylicum TaxID=169679 RepID=A0A1S8NDY3_CLOSA|nr:MerR family transcriptional regulator [Clostridium saccharobutylicum]OOM14592.1 HTH-type transcriptional regulator AdhR [Clostridium saccharobutylicum]
MKNRFTIKEVAKLTGLSEHTLRFYEKQQLIKNISRDENGYRTYSDFDIEWIHFLIKVKNTGMPLNELQKYSELMAQGNLTLPEREKMLLKHRERVENEISDLTHTLTKINEKLDRYHTLMNQLKSV